MKYLTSERLISFTEKLPSQGQEWGSTHSDPEPEATRALHGSIYRSLGLKTILKEMRWGKWSNCKLKCICPCQKPRLLFQTRSTSSAQSCEALKAFADLPQDKKVTLQGAVYKPDPAKFGPGPYPTVVSCYGGPHAPYLPAGDRWFGGAYVFASGCKWLQGEGLSLMKHDEPPITRMSTEKCVFFVAASCTLEQSPSEILGSSANLPKDLKTQIQEISRVQDRTITLMCVLFQWESLELSRSEVQFISNNWGMTADLRAQAGSV